MNLTRLNDEIATSLRRADEYPTNIIQRSSNAYHSALNGQKQQLGKAEGRLFVKLPAQVEIPIRDLYAAADPKSKNVHSLEGLDKVFGLQVTQGPNRPNEDVLCATKRDPKSRLIYLYGEDSRDPLRLSRDMLTRILTFHQVMPVYLDFILAFGAQDEAEDLMFSGFREQTTLADPPRGPQSAELGRSGKQYQLCYNLKTVACAREDPFDELRNMWSIRQVAIHHQYDVVESNALWIVTKGHRDLYEQYMELTGPAGRSEDRSFRTPEECFRSSLSVHLLYCHWATEGWRWYIRWLEKKIEKETGIAMFGPRSDGFHHKKYQPEDIMTLHRREDTASNVIMVLDSNIEVMSLLRSFYLKLLKNPDFPLRDSCVVDIKEFVGRVDDMIQNFRMELARAKLLVKVTTDRKELVVQHLQSQAAERMESVSHKMEKEAVVVRIITVVTLFYLPPTFVSTFFSTDIIKYQNDGEPLGNGTFSYVALTRWLQVTLPLTVLTLIVAWTLLQWANLKRAGYVLRSSPARKPARPSDPSIKLHRVGTPSIV